MKNFSIKLMILGCMMMLIGMAIFLVEDELSYTFYTGILIGGIFNLIGFLTNDKDSINTKQSAEMFDAEEYLNNLDIWNHPTISDRENKTGYDVAQLMADFANEYYGKND